ncbi:MAG: hypothetical protein E4H14_09275 [Candidatus Thorarchaeota archaeon]|nr:MAG: hypothetical protein E4H14_09275 [Candidatus Thorarchaeota archaeon]
MLTKKQFALLFCVFLFVIISFQAQPVEALPFDGEFTDQPIAAGNWYKVWDTMTTGDVITGYFETHSSTQGLDFFICDSANLDLWEGGFTSTRYEPETNMHTSYFSFTVPNSDTWYCVFSNRGGSTTVTVDIGVDTNGDNTPIYSSSTYDYTGYGIVLENNEYHDVFLYLDAGDVIDGHFSTFFPTDGLDFFICDTDNFDSWELGYSSTGYSIETDMYYSSIDSFTIPTSGYWYCVFYAEDEIDTITFSYGISVDTSGAITDGSTTVNEDLIIFGALFAVFFGLMICCAINKKRTQTSTPPTVDHYAAPPYRPTTTGTTVREVTTRVLVICPYCGCKNDQGILTCTNCDAEL